MKCPLMDLSNQPICSLGIPSDILKTNKKEQMKNKLFYSIVVFMLFSSITTAQSTLDKLILEDAQSAYSSGNYTVCLKKIEELEKRGNKGLVLAHMKIMATSKLNFLDYEQVIQFKKYVNHYLENHDNEDFMQQYSDVYEVSKTLSSDKYDEGKLAEKKANRYYSDKDYKNAMQWFLKADSYGNSSSSIGVYMGYMYASGLGTEKNYPEAIKWYTKAANQGNAAAQNNLGVLYNNGQGVEKDLNKAAEWYTKAANQGDAYAQNNLGILYQYGNGVEKDLNKAIEWYIKAANQGNINAQESLRNIYQYGYGNLIERDDISTIYWNEVIIENPKANEHLKREAIQSMASTYLYKKDYTEAIKWYLHNDLTLGLAKEEEQFVNIFRATGLAAAYEGLGEWEKAYDSYIRVLDHHYASMKLGLYYYEGKVVEQSYSKAYELWSKKKLDDNYDYDYNLFCKTVLLYHGKTTKIESNNDEELSLAIKLLKEHIKRTKGRFLQVAIKNLKNDGITNERFPQFIKDREDFFNFLEKEHNIVLEEEE